MWFICFKRLFDEYDMSFWIVDSSVINQGCSYLLLINSTIEIKRSDTHHQMGNAYFVSTNASGEVRLLFKENKYLIINNRYYISELLKIWLIFQGYTNKNISLYYTFRK